MALADPFDSSSAYGFIVTIDGIEIPKVTEVSGPQVRGRQDRAQAADRATASTSCAS